MTSRRHHTKRKLLLNQEYVQNPRKRDSLSSVFFSSFLSSFRSRKLILYYEIPSLIHPVVCEKPDPRYMLSITTISRSKLLEEQVFKREQSARLLLIIPTMLKWEVVPLDTVPEKRPPQETMSTLQVHLKEKCHLLINKEG